MRDIEEIINERGEVSSFGKKMLALAIKCEGDPYALYGIISRKEADMSESEIDELVGGFELRGLGVSMVILGDDDYPECFKEISDPPIVLFVAGEISNLDKMADGKMGGSLAIAGSWGGLVDTAKDPKAKGYSLIISECPFLKGDEASKGRARWLSSELLSLKSYAGKRKESGSEDEWKAA